MTNTTEKSIKKLTKLIELEIAMTRTDAKLDNDTFLYQTMLYNFKNNINNL